MNPNNQTYYSSAGGANPNRKKRIVLIIFLVVAIVGLLVYLLFAGGGNGNKKTTSKSTKSTNKAYTLPLATLANPEFVTPNMTGYIRRSNFTVEVGDYSTSNNGCNLQFGVVSATELPGATAEDVTITNLGATEEAGAVGPGPQVGNDLVLSSSDGKAKYIMPTLDFSYTRDGVSYRASYSVSFLAQNKRAFVRRYCSVTGGSVSDKDFKAINDKAKEIKVKAE